MEPEQKSAQDLPYTNRELREKWHSIANDVQGILNQTTKTNGRVTALEKWQYTSIGAISILSLIVVPVLLWALTVLMNVDTKIQESVDKALSTYHAPK